MPEKTISGDRRDMAGIPVCVRRQPPMGQMKQKIAEEVAVMSSDK